MHVTVCTTERPQWKLPHAPRAHGQATDHIEAASPRPTGRELHAQPWRGWPSTRRRSGSSSLPECTARNLPRPAVCVPAASPIACSCSAAASRQARHASRRARSFLQSGPRLQRRAQECQSSVQRCMQSRYGDEAAAGVGRVDAAAVAHLRTCSRSGTDKERFSIAPSRGCLLQPADLERLPDLERRLRLPAQRNNNDGDQWRSMARREGEGGEAGAGAGSACAAQGGARPHRAGDGKPG